jgi:DNA primase
MLDTKAHAITALDNDTAGRDMTASINSVLPVKAEVAVPAHKDWNEDLMAELTAQAQAQAQAQALAEEARMAEEEKIRAMEPEHEIG